MSMINLGYLLMGFSLGITLTILFFYGVGVLHAKRSSLTRTYKGITHISSKPKLSDAHGTTVTSKPKMYKIRPEGQFVQDDYKGTYNIHRSSSWQFLGAIMRECIESGTHKRLLEQFDVTTSFLGVVVEIPPSVQLPNSSHTIMFPKEYNLKMTIDCTDDLDTPRPFVGDIRCGKEKGKVDLRGCMKKSVESLIEDIKSCIDIELDEWSSAWKLNYTEYSNYQMTGEWVFQIEGKLIRTVVSFSRVL